jgi:hypothetical protein
MQNEKTPNEKTPNEKMPNEKNAERKNAECTRIPNEGPDLFTSGLFLMLKLLGGLDLTSKTGGAEMTEEGMTEGNGRRNTPSPERRPIFNLL